MLRRPGRAQVPRKAKNNVRYRAAQSQLPTTLSMTTPRDATVAVYWVAMETRSVWDRRSRTVAEVDVIPRLVQVTVMSALAPDPIR